MKFHRMMNDFIYFCNCQISPDAWCSGFLVHFLLCFSADESVSTSDLGIYVAGNSLTSEHPYYEIVLSSLNDSKQTGLGLVAKNYSLDGMPGWFLGSIGWHFDDSK
jgi:hypothetical protein